MKGPIVVADDFGLCEKHDAIIIDLMYEKKINAVSVLVHGELNENRIKELKLNKNKISVGLHLNLTTPLPKIVKTFSIKRLIISNLFRFTHNNEIKHNLSSQIESFKNIFGEFPDFIDGHQHIHMLPGILTNLLTLLDNETLPPKFWIRTSASQYFIGFLNEYHNSGVKSLLINVLSWVARKRIIKKSLITNRDFTGFFNLKAETRKFKCQYKMMLKNLHSNQLVMVHPGSSDSKVELPGHSNKLRSLEAKILKESTVNLVD